MHDLKKEREKAAKKQLQNKIKNFD